MDTSDPQIATPSPVIIPPAGASSPVPRPDSVDEMATNLHENNSDASLPAGTLIVDAITHVSIINAKLIYQQMLVSQDKLFFISYRGVNTIQPRWYLCTINMSESDMSDVRQYHVDFFRKHRSDEKNKYDNSCSWPDWYEIKWFDKERSCWDYGRTILVRPNGRPNLDKHSKYNVTVDFTGEDKLLVGPFRFCFQVARL